MENKMEFLKQNGMDMDSALSYLGDYETIDEIIRDVRQHTYLRKSNMQNHDRSAFWFWPLWPADYHRNVAAAER